jgi:hypothetical protein
VDPLVDALLKVHRAVNAPSPAVMAARAAQLGARLGRNTVYDLLNRKGAPSRATVDAFVAVCLDIARRSGIAVLTEWSEPNFWEALCEGVSRRRPLVQIGRIPPEAEAFQDRGLALTSTDRVGGGCQVLSGLGGVGKTQLAAHFAARVRRDREVDVLVWIHAASRDDIVNQYVAAAGLLGIDTRTLSAEQAADQFLVWLEGTVKRWLIVLDDVSDPNDLAELWPPPRGHTIVTSRRADAVLSEQGRTLVKVGVYTDDEAHRYLHGALGSTSLADDVEGVAGDLGNLPLALAHAAAFMKNKSVSCVGYRERFAHRRSLAEVMPPRTLCPMSIAVLSRQPCPWPSRRPTLCHRRASRRPS